MSGKAPEQLIFNADVLLTNPNLVGGEGDQGHLRFTYEGRDVGLGHMEPVTIPAQDSVKVKAAVAIDTPPAFATSLEQLCIVLLCFLDISSRHAASPSKSLAQAHIETLFFCFKHLTARDRLTT